MDHRVFWFMQSLVVRWRQCCPLSWPVSLYKRFCVLVFCWLAGFLQCRALYFVTKVKYAEAHCFALKLYVASSATKCEQVIIMGFMILVTLFCAPLVALWCLKTGLWTWYFYFRKRVRISVSSVWPHAWKLVWPRRPLHGTRNRSAAYYCHSGGRGQARQVGREEGQTFAQVWTLLQSLCIGGEATSNIYGLFNAAFAFSNTWYIWYFKAWSFLFEFVRARLAKLRSVIKRNWRDSS